MNIVKGRFKRFCKARREGESAVARMI